MDRSQLALWIVERYTHRRDFIRKRGRSKPWFFRCGYCAGRFHDEELTHYWYRDDINEPFCSERCARLAPVSKELLDRITESLESNNIEIF